MSTGATSWIGTSMPLKRQLTKERVEAALRLHSRLTGWESADESFSALKQAMPGFDLSSCLIKSAAINQLYYTSVYRIYDMAKNVERVMAAKPDDPIQLVTAIATLDDPKKPSGVTRHFSFASKFAHFFIDADSYPIWDAYVIDMLGCHTGESLDLARFDSPYGEFCARFEAVRRATGVPYSNRDMDRYLWLAGNYRASREGRGSHINAALAALFDQDDADVQADLERLLPEGAIRSRG